MPDKKAAADEQTVEAAAADQVDVTEPAANEAKRLDEVVPGGRYMVDGQLVDANGKPIEE